MRMHEWMASWQSEGKLNDGEEMRHAESHQRHPSRDLIRKLILPDASKLPSAAAHAPSFLLSSSADNKEGPAAGEEVDQLVAVEDCLTSDQTFVFNLKKENLLQRKTILYDLSWQLTEMSDRRTHWRSFSPFSAEICNRIEALLFATKGRRTPNTKHAWKLAEKAHPLKKSEEAPAYESEVQSINRFYERVCRFVDHQKMADPLMDILIYFLKEIFEVEGLHLQAEVLLRLCQRLAGIPEDVANLGRMVCIMPILQFIAKELHITSAEFDEYIRISKVDRMQSDVLRPVQS